MNRSQIFKSAWAIAKNAAIKFGGKAKQYIAMALTMAYKAAKAPANQYTIIVNSALSMCIYPGFRQKNWLMSIGRQIGTGNVEAICAEVVRRHEAAKAKFKFNAPELSQYINYSIDKQING